MPLWRGGFSWNQIENVQRKKNWTARIEVKAVYVLRSALWTESLDVALSIGGCKKEDVKNTHLKVATAVKSGGHLIWKGALVTVEVCVLCGWTFSNHFDIALWYSWPWVRSSDLFLVRCCALKRTANFVMESNGYVFILKPNWFWHEMLWCFIPDIDLFWHWELFK